MIVLGILGGIGALAIGLIIAQLRGRGIDARAVDISKSSAGTRVGEYFPPPDDGRP